MDAKERKAEGAVEWSLLPGGVFIIMQVAQVKLKEVQFSECITLRQGVTLSDLLKNESGRMKITFTWEPAKRLLAKACVEAQ